MEAADGTNPFQSVVRGVGHAVEGRCQSCKLHVFPCCDKVPFPLGRWSPPSSNWAGLPVTSILLTPAMYASSPAVRGTLLPTLSTSPRWCWMQKLCSLQRHMASAVILPSPIDDERGLQRIPYRWMSIPDTHSILMHNKEW
jgi:hypothetical protein